MSGYTTIKPYYEVVDPIKVLNETYTVTFNDSFRIKPKELTPVNISTKYSIQDQAGNFLASGQPFDPKNGTAF